MHKLLAAFLCSLAVSATAGAQWTHEGKVEPDQPWRKSVGAFGAMLLVTSQPQAFLESWDRPSTPDYQPSISTTNEARRGEIVAAVVLFLPCKADGKGVCDLEVDFKVLAPDGSVYGEFKGGPVSKGKAPAPVGIIQRGESVLNLAIEDQDALGEYRIEAVVRDKVAGIEIPLVQKLLVGPREPAPQP